MNVDPLKTLVAETANYEREADRLSALKVKLEADQAALIAEGDLDSDRQFKKMSECRLRLDLIPRRFEALRAEIEKRQAEIEAMLKPLRRAVHHFLGGKRQALIDGAVKALGFKTEKEAAHCLDVNGLPAMHRLRRAFASVTVGSPIRRDGLTAAAQQFLAAVEKIEAEFGQIS